MDKETIFNGFAYKCDQLVNSNYILSLPMVKDILEYVVENASLLELISNCITNVNYISEFNNCISIDSSGKKIITLPKSNRYIISIVMGILYDIDNNNNILSQLLAEYFYNKNIEVSFSSFTNTLIVPLVLAVKGLYLDSTDTTYENEFDYNEENMPFIDSTKILDNISLNIKDFNTAIRGSNSYSDLEIYELTYLLNALYHSISIGDEINIKSNYIAIKYLFKDTKKFKKLFYSLEQELIRFQLINIK